MHAAFATHDPGIRVIGHPRGADLMVAVRRLRNDLRQSLSFGIRVFELADAGAPQFAIDDLMAAKDRTCIDVAEPQIHPDTGQTKRIAALFARASVPCRISENIQGELWTKLVWNCALNAVSALGRAKYGLIASSTDAWKVVETAVYEVLAVARAAGVHPPGLQDPKAALAGALKIATQMAEALSSTGQDLIRGKRTEIDSLNGYISRRGMELGVPTPVNHALYALVKLAEGRS